MKVALIHDYLSEFGGAERVLLALTEIYPKAPIYTAFYRKGSAAYERFKSKKIVTSWVQKIPGFSKYLYSPLRFLAPKIWNSFSTKGGQGFSDYDLVISSSSWYVTKGFGGIRPLKFAKNLKSKGYSSPAVMDKNVGEITRPVEICYCHTPPRWLYGYRTSINWQRYWPVRVYGQVVGHFMRHYDFKAAQRVDEFIANSKEVKKRIAKFYRREAKVIYPPVELPHVAEALRGKPKGDYYFISSRIVGGKGLELAVKTAKKYKLKLKIAGQPAGYGGEYEKLKKMGGDRVEWLGRVSDEELARLYAGAKAFLGLAECEDFGITPVEAMLMGTPVVAFEGGGYLETVIEGKTGVFFKDYSVKGLSGGIKKLRGLKIRKEDCVKQAKNFSKERFKKEIKRVVAQHLPGKVG